MITSIEQLKDLVAFMKSHGVDTFNINGVSVTFGMNSTTTQTTVPGETPSEQLANIKTTLQALKNEADADELWSV